jgi:hypothetical protein
MPIISVDLAYRSYADIGIVLLEDGPNGVVWNALQIERPGREIPASDVIADFLVENCLKHSSSIIVLDGPQGWKDPSNGHAHARDCERILNTPAKTGLPGSVKPANYLAFVKFSIEVFDALCARGWKRYDSTNWKSGDPVVVESFPLSAWRSLKLPTLPAKSKAKSEGIARFLDLLVSCALVQRSDVVPTHDQLQAIVAGLAGLALLTNKLECYEVVGTAPFILEEKWREGFIVNPKNSPSAGSRS